MADVSLRSSSFTSLARLLDASHLFSLTQTPDSCVPPKSRRRLDKVPKSQISCLVFPFLMSNAVSKTELSWGGNVLVKPLNVFFFSPFIFQEIICQKNTVSTQSNPCLPLAFAFHTLLNHLWHIAHIVWCRKYAFLQHASCSVFSTLCFPCWCEQAFSPLQNTFVR